MNIPKGEFDAYIFDHDSCLSLSIHVRYDGGSNLLEKTEIILNLLEKLPSHTQVLECTIRLKF